MKNAMPFKTLFFCGEEQLLKQVFQNCESLLIAVILKNDSIGGIFLSFFISF